MSKALRPITFEDYIGQDCMKPMLKVMVESAKKRNDSVGHLLFSGPPGLGKTTIAQIIANENNSDIHFVNAPTIGSSSQLKMILMKLKEKDVLFIDEIHRLNIKVEEQLYPAVEDFTVEVEVGLDTSKKVMQLCLPKFTLVGATTKQGSVSKPMRTRFQQIFQMQYYTVEELAEIALGSACKLDLYLTPCGADQIAVRSRGTPRTANKLLLTVQDFAIVEGSSQIDGEYVNNVLTKIGIDDAGLTQLDRRYLNILIDNFNCEPTGVDTLASVIGESVETIEEVEAYLLKIGFLRKTRSGRVPSESAIEHTRGR